MTQPITIYTEARTLRRDGQITFSEGFTSAPPPNPTAAPMAASRAFSKPIAERLDEAQLP